MNANRQIYVEDLEWMITGGTTDLEALDSLTDEQALRTCRATVRKWPTTC